MGAWVSKLRTRGMSGCRDAHQWTRKTQSTMTMGKLMMKKLAESQKKMTSPQMRWKTKITPTRSQAKNETKKGYAFGVTLGPYLGKYQCHCYQSLLNEIQNLFNSNKFEFLRADRKLHKPVYIHSPTNNSIQIVNKINQDALQSQLQHKVPP